MRVGISSGRCLSDSEREEVLPPSRQDCLYLGLGRMSQWMGMQADSIATMHVGYFGSIGLWGKRVHKQTQRGK